jgi:hypothetical protein
MHGAALPSQLNDEVADNQAIVAGNCLIMKPTLRLNNPGTLGDLAAIAAPSTEFSQNGTHFSQMKTGYLAIRSKVKPLPFLISCWLDLFPL